MQNQRDVVVPCQTTSWNTTDRWIAPGQSAWVSVTVQYERTPLRGEFEPVKSPMPNRPPNYLLATSVLDIQTGELPRSRVSTGVVTIGRGFEVMPGRHGAL